MSFLSNVFVSSGKNRYSRANSSSNILGATNQVNALATLPRKARTKIKSDASFSRKLNLFFQGKAK